MAFAAVSCTPSTGDSSSSSSKKKEDPKPTPTPTPMPTPTPSPEDYEIPLTFEFAANGLVRITDPWSTLKYQLNDGVLTPVKAAEGTTTASISVKKNEKISFFAEASDAPRRRYMNIKCSSDCYVYGNIMSLVTLKSGSSDWDSSATELLFKNYHSLILPFYPSGGYAFLPFGGEEEVFYSPFEIFDNGFAYSAVFVGR